MTVRWTGWVAARDAVRTQLWPLPTVGVIAAVAVGVCLPRVDARVDGSLPAWVSRYLFSGDAGAARTVLEAVSGSLITVTSLTFSLTVVTLQLASGQFSPRLLRTFTRDLFVQATLALFLGTFIYTLTVLRTVRTGSATQTAFVPRLSVTGGYLLALASVVGLVLFLAHLAQQIRVETMLRNVHKDAEATVHDVLDHHDPGRVPRHIPPVPTTATTVSAPQSGFLVQVDQAGLLAVAVDHDSVIRIDRLPGASLIAGTPVAFFWPSSGTTEVDPGTNASSTIGRQIASALVVGFERTSVQDVGFGLRQLTDVVTKALSPGINDPTTAVHALSHSAALLCDLAGHELGTVTLADTHGTTRVILARPDLSDFLEMAVTQPRRYGAADSAVVLRLYGLLREVAWHCRPEQRSVVADQLARLTATVDAQDFDSTEREQMRHCSCLVERALNREWPPAPTPP